MLSGIRLKYDIIVFPLPAHEARGRRGRALSEQDATVGEKVKGGAPVERLEKLLDRVPGLDALLKQIDTRIELESLVQVVVLHVTETGPLNQSEVNAARPPRRDETNEDYT